MAQDLLKIENDVFEYVGKQYGNATIEQNESLGMKYKRQVRIRRLIQDKSRRSYWMRMMNFGQNFVINISLL